MDNQGFISIEYLFSIFVILIIAISLLFFSQSAIESSLNMQDSLSHRLILDDVANTISQVNSNGEGYSKSVTLPPNVGYYEITVEKDKLTIEYDDKKGETLLLLTNIDSKYKMHSGHSYTISKVDDGKLVIK
ncbi:MAG: hypothetical protein U0L42_10165 [Methanobrevibacter sp.]|uniref:hypothetical protein n=1 Tax=Methanobrevibacter sp. TaxID=66852 RepID=UPI002E798725|nr:hypothetical protein [Methanobrevibacter sp.]MEE0936026.1 hypothetical protein [Methanobrevibacter sp.]